MSINPKPLSTNVEINSTEGDLQLTFAENMAARVRSLAMPLNYNASSLGSALGVSSSAAANYWNGKRPYPSETLPTLAAILSTSVEFLLSGARKSGLAAVSVDDAAWEQVPLFDLRNVTDTGKGEAVSWTPFRVDWLNRTLGTSFDLYLVRLLSDYHGRTGDRELSEDDLVFVREVTPAELQDGHIVIWRREGGITIARYVIYRRDRDDGDIVYADEVSDDQFVPICRIYGKFLQRI